MPIPARTSHRAAPTLAPETLERFRAGDRRAFEEVVRACLPLVRAIVARFWPGAFEQEEAMQEIWVHAFRQRLALDPSRAEAFPGWLAVLARRRCIDLLRQSGARSPPGAEEGVAAEVVEDAAPVPPEQHARAELAALSAAVDAFRGRLDPPWRRFFDLHFVEGLAYAEIAEALSISRLRCRYMRKVLAGRAMRSPELMAALGRVRAGGRGAS
jgi:RNA polymerase sigma factor (sigma-70 family)